MYNGKRLGGHDIPSMIYVELKGETPEHNDDSIITEIYGGR
jgi:hypothetical protein